jgi:hypothetical protein
MSVKRIINNGKKRGDHIVIAPASFNARAFYKIPNSFNLLSGTTPFTQPRTR